MWLFDKAADAPDVDRFTAAREMESGVSCGRFIDGLGVRAVVCQVRNAEEGKGERCGEGRDKNEGEGWERLGCIC